MTHANQILLFTILIVVNILQFLFFWFIYTDRLRFKTKPESKARYLKHLKKRKKQDSEKHEQYLNQVRRHIYDGDVCFIGIGVTPEEFEELSKLTNNPKVIEALRARIMVRVD